MAKTLGVLIGGIFVGAVGMEVLRKKYPECVDKFYAKVHQVTSAAKEAFKEGYHRATKSPEPA